ncbi:hypothetical protein H696_00407 [Fonticula alba]|uniref:Uncharacterized protein n=1 Tax=Fonticula alba TaxID=691883 RepID=A0A058ZFV2_FONAL|nr:hypothetical protein H696_00407 [Fonticula alba]KCV72831.1 hypothetical protein H696_00407 [Fonticula alba]|eukprot:XP_009492532.1 hypothetical protein H696_00407 [Fonticula alba]
MASPASSPPAPAVIKKLFISAALTESGSALPAASPGLSQAGRRPPSPGAAGNTHFWIQGDVVAKPSATSLVLDDGTACILARPAQSGDLLLGVLGRLQVGDVVQLIGKTGPLENPEPGSQAWGFHALKAIVVTRRPLEEISFVMSCLADTKRHIKNEL